MIKCTITFLDHSTVFQSQPMVREIETTKTFRTLCEELNDNKYIVLGDTIYRTQDIFTIETID